MRLTKIIILMLILSGCSESTNNLDPGDRVLQFLESPDYELLSEVDRSVWSREEWNKYAGSWNAPRPTLSPTSRYFELEQHLYEFASYQLEGVTDNSDDSYSVTVVFRWPSVLEEVYFFDDSLIEFVEDELTNLLTAYESGRLTPETIKYSEAEEVFAVVSDGIFINAEEAQRRREENEEVDKLFIELSHIDDYDLDFDFYSLGSSKLTRQIEELREIGIEQINLDISSLESAIVKAKELQRDRYNYSSLNTLGKLHQASLLLESDSIFSNSLEFNEVRVAEAQGRRGIGLFFDWRITGDLLPHEAVSAGFQARYFDSNSNQIGSEEFLISVISAENGDRGGSVGRIIDNQGVARRVSSVEIGYLVPSRAPRFNCKFDEAIKCEQR
ncbi:hypothetical protein [Vreelandella aquamarina]|uniref:Uncharacterized protein n=1 Tax=Vreelandella aquamarina TaxID=77097 RepID=A0A1H8PHJ0_9GAMM|nr:hypothetical protein [Halomonas aquamarina]SEO41128.1 hypothetical protein SAMN04490369_10865 [Halomonas aquamarina]